VVCNLNWLYNHENYYILFCFYLSMKSIKDNIVLSDEILKVFQKLSDNIFSDTRVLVAVSWWPDSMLACVTLYRYFLENKFDLNNLFFVHCNHKTRVETDEEEKFILSFFEWLNLYVCVYDWIKKWENELREWRYSKFNEVIKNNKIDFLVTWHNLTDRIESTFMNMCRGAGLNWFLSMKFLDDNNLIDWANILRPLLNFPKKKIEQYCLDLDIPFVVDNSNFDQETSFRNKIRLSILPQLADISNKNDWISCSFFDSMNQVYSDIESISSTPNIWKFVEIKTSYYWNSNFAFLWEIPFGFIDENILLQVFRKFNAYLDVTKKTLDDFLMFFHKAEQWYKYINWVYFFISNGKIFIIKAKKNFWEKCIEKKMIINNIWNIEFWENILHIDEVNLIWKELRYPEIGDKYWSKSWSKYCINKKIPIFWRNFIPVVVDWKQILKYFYQ